eukprot:m.35284 g.35284  ORF g.35284 m.35284 type:complete len:654 (+) comp8864_c0_seq3:1002-2963(+)
MYSKFKDGIPQGPFIKRHPDGKKTYEDEGCSVPYDKENSKHKTLGLEAGTTAEATYLALLAKNVHFNDHEAIENAEKQIFSYTNDMKYTFKWEGHLEKGKPHGYGIFTVLDGPHKGHKYYGKRKHGTFEDEVVSQGANGNTHLLACDRMLGVISTTYSIHKPSDLHTAKKIKILARRAAKKAKQIPLAKKRFHTAMNMSYWHSSRITYFTLPFGVFTVVLLSKAYLTRLKYSNTRPDNSNSLEPLKMPPKNVIPNLDYANAKAYMEAAERRNTDLELMGKNIIQPEEEEPYVKTISYTEIILQKSFMFNKEHCLAFQIMRLANDRNAEFEAIKKRSHAQWNYTIWTDLRENLSRFWKYMQDDPIIIDVPPNSPHRWPPACQREITNKGGGEFLVVDQDGALDTEIRSMILSFEGNRQSLESEDIKNIIAINIEENLAAFYIWVKQQKIAYQSENGLSVTNENHKMYIHWDRDNPLLKSMVNWLRTIYPSRVAGSLQESPPYQSIIVYHGMFGDLTEAKHICKTGFRDLGLRNDGWYGKGVYFTPDLAYALAYARSKLQERPSENGKVLVIACEMAVFNPYPVSDEFVMRGKPIPGQADVNIAVVQHADDLSQTSTVPIDPSRWKTDRNPDGVPVSTEIAMSKGAVLPRFILEF